MIKVKDLTKKYGSVIAVNNITFEVENNDILGLLGPNGAGKSTTINILSGILSKNSGKIEFMQKDFDKNKKELKSHMGLVPQDIVIFDDLTVRENLEYFGSLYRIKGKDLKKQVDQTLEFIGLTNVMNKMPRALSGGMKRRLNIGCAIVHNPKLIILDEPTVGIDAQSRNHILKSIKELNALGTTVIYTSHYMEEIESICNRIIIIDHGNIIESGTKNDILSKYNMEEKFQIYMNKTPEKELIQAIKSLSGVVSCKADDCRLEIISKTEEHELKKILEIIEQKKYEYYSIDMKKNNLEDIFLQLTGRNLRD